MMYKPLVALLILPFLLSRAARGEENPLPQPWGYAAAMKKAASKSHGRSGIVLHIGDSITYANPYGQWPRRRGQDGAR